MIEPSVFYARLEVCKKCTFFSGVCLKGHVASSPTGCPMRKFEPVNHAAWDQDRPEAKPVGKAPTGCCGSQDVKPMEWTDVLAELATHMRIWVAAGMPLVNGRAHDERYAICKGCDHFRYFQCRLCKCICYVKTKLATEYCPDRPPRWKALVQVSTTQK